MERATEPSASMSSTVEGSARTTSRRRSGAQSARTRTWSAAVIPSVSPCCADRLRMSTLRARASSRARRMEGRMRWGSTELYQEPGPRTTQSAPSMACTATGWAWASAGTRATFSSRPRAVATATWPLTRSRRSPSTTSASMTSGEELMGTTRPWMASSRPTQSSPPTSSPSSCHRARMSRLPRAWLSSSPWPAKRCWRTSRQVSPHSESSVSAASAIRRSPGGRQPNSRRRRPEEPPSSATVTTAVSRCVTWRRARRVADRPCPPPRATTAGPSSPRRGHPSASRVVDRFWFMSIPFPGPGAGRRRRSPPSAGAPRCAPRRRPSGACRRCSRRRW